MGRAVLAKLQAVAFIPADFLGPAANDGAGQSPGPSIKQCSCFIRYYTMMVRVVSRANYLYNHDIIFV